MRRIRRALYGTVLVILLLSTGAKTQGMPAAPGQNEKLAAILNYISSSWASLTRSTTSCTGVTDTKLAAASMLYVPADYAIPSTVADSIKRCNLRLEHLPFAINGPGQVTGNAIDPAGLLFLENPYVVPGGRFNEMYGWDSYFIIRGLLQEGKLDLARGMVENFFFEIEHYGAVLNANRTYYLTRSQPPFLSSMVRAVYEAERAKGDASLSWLAKAYHYVERDYEMWTRAPHLAGSTGMSRYYDFGEGPVPEGLKDEVNYYHDVLAYFLRANRPTASVVESDKPISMLRSTYALQLCADASPSSTGCQVLQYVALSPEYYKGDRAMRESGFDPSFRFGAYGADTPDYVPVCLNSLLYKTEKDMRQMSLWLGKKQEAIRWQQRAQKRRHLIQSLLWNSRRGLYFDYDFQTKKLSSYVYATTFYPLWAGVATFAQARAVEHNLNLFEHQGGLAMSTQDTGVQWDYPFGWAPLQLLAVEGLRRYGYNDDANRISTEFLAMVLTNFERDSTIREKYDVVRDSANLRVAEGYRANVIGFGWTNAVFLELLSRLPKKWIDRIGTQALVAPRCVPHKKMSRAANQHFVRTPCSDSPAPQTAGRNSTC